MNIVKIIRVYPDYKIPRLQDYKIRRVNRQVGDQRLSIHSEYDKIRSRLNHAEAEFDHVSNIFVMDAQRDFLSVT